MKNKEKEFTISLYKTKISIEVNENQFKEAIKYVKDRMFYTKTSTLFNDKVGLTIYKFDDFNNLITYLLIEL